MKLCNPKTGIIKKQDKKPVFRPDEKLEVHAKFASSNIKVVFVPQIKPIDLVSGKNGGKSVEAVDTEVMKERSMVIDATIVRIMKARKTMSHIDLLTMVVE